MEGGLGWDVYLVSRNVTRFVLFEGGFYAFLV